MRTYKSQSASMPSDWDLDSSATTVYKNYNITSADSDGITMYYYDVDEYTRIEYDSMVLMQTRADTDYIAVMMGVDL
jgi:hypothetical protein